MFIGSIIFEAAVAVIALLAVRPGRRYPYFFAFTFSAYVLYDLTHLLRGLDDAQYDPVHLLRLGLDEPLLSGLFLLATLSALVGIWGLYKEQQ
jgi:hypothetical protein